LLLKKRISLSGGIHYIKKDGKWFLDICTFYHRVGSLIVMHCLLLIKESTLMEEYTATITNIIWFGDLFCLPKFPFYSAADCLITL
jgi:hypothetical protein